jgi:O-antigen/teichoic acid export membrane protein
MTTPYSQQPGSAQRVARNFSALVLASLFSKGLLFIWQIVLGNYFTPYEYGVYNTVTSLMAVSTSLVGFGMGMIVIREVARQPARLRAYWAAMLSLQTLFALAAYVAVLLTAVASGYNEQILAFAAVGGLSLLVDMVGNVAYDLLIAQERMLVTATIEVGHIVARIALAGVMLANGSGLPGIYLATIATGLLRSAALNAVYVRQGVLPHFPVPPGVSWQLLRDGAPLALSALLSLGYQHADKLMTTAIIGAQYTGFLGPAFIINYGMIELISTTVLVAVYPVLARYYLENQHIFSDIVARLARFMLLCSLPLALVFSIFATPIVLTLYNPSYAPTASLLAILVWSTVLMMVGNVFNKALLIQNRQRVSLVIRAFALGINIALNALFLTLYRDPRGASLATVIAEATSLLLSALVFQAQGFTWRAVLPGMLRILLLGALSGAVMLAVGQLGWVLGAVSGLAVYAAGVLLGRVLAPDDWAFLYRFAGAMPGGGHLQRLWRRIAAVPANVIE